MIFLLLPAIFSPYIKLYCLFCFYLQNTYMNTPKICLQYYHTTSFMSISYKRGIVNKKVTIPEGAKIMSTKTINKNDVLTMDTTGIAALIKDRKISVYDVVSIYIDH